MIRYTGRLLLIKEGSVDPRSPYTDSSRTLSSISNISENNSLTDVESELRQRVNIVYDRESGAEGHFVHTGTSSTTTKGITRSNVVLGKDGTGGSTCSLLEGVAISGASPAHTRFWPDNSEVDTRNTDLYAFEVDMQTASQLGGNAHPFEVDTRTADLYAFEVDTQTASQFGGNAHPFEVDTRTADL